ncbi:MULTISPECIES: hypothetical protein [Aequorivita]|uniref:Uncharacterized protein n=2 Tax=Aequorivita TaxID=153265 RepID=A0AB35YX19_9FLAO|nr:hypothetical protein [Aequorivita sp. Ant34-E75]WGF93897.1 hypothetical protein QCQ61_06840 [Aequorivita sp. Ant34-E75]
MKIKSNATSNELSSPFYKINAEFCSEFEKYIATKNGKVKGNYNAWSYLVEGKITSPKSWYLKYKKATYTSAGNLLLSSKKQNLLTMVEWSSPWQLSTSSNFSINRKNSGSFLKKPLNRDTNDFLYSNKYIITNGESNTTLLKKLYTNLEPLFISGEVYSIHIKNDSLLISLRTDKHHFEIFEKLLNL